MAWAPAHTHNVHHALTALAAAQSLKHQHQAEIWLCLVDPATFRTEPVNAPQTLSRCIGCALIALNNLSSNPCCKATGIMHMHWLRLIDPISDLQTAFTCTGCTSLALQHLSLTLYQNINWANALAVTA